MPRFLVSPHPVMVGLVHGCCELKRKEEEEKVSWCRARQAPSPSTIRLGACCQLQAAPHHMAPSHRRPFRGAAGWSSSGRRCRSVGKRRRRPGWNLEVSPSGRKLQVETVSVQSAPDISWLGMVPSSGKDDPLFRLLCCSC